MNLWKKYLNPVMPGDSKGPYIRKQTGSYKLHDCFCMHSNHHPLKINHVLRHAKFGLITV